MPRLRCNSVLRILVIFTWCSTVKINLKASLPAPPFSFAGSVLGVPLSFSSELLEHLKTFTVFAVVMVVFSMASDCTVSILLYKKHKVERTVAER